jgi:hypothetical protein
MVSPRTFNLIAFAATVVGSGIGMFGALMQANAYYPFRITQFASHISRVFVKWLTEGKEAAFRQVHTSAKLGEARGERRDKSLVGLYLVFCGFLLNLVGAALALAATLVDTAAKPHG